MKKFIVFILVICWSITGNSQDVAAKLDEYFTKAQQANMFNGTVLVAQKENLVLNKGYGFKNAENKTLNDANTIYQIGSVTKQFTAAIILKLAEEGKLSLSDKVNKYFPGFKDGNKITIEHLLSHTSGIWNYTNDRNFMQTRVEMPLQMDSMLLLIKNRSLEFEPGSKFSYSNSGYMVLGYIIEKVTGKKYETVVRQTIFKPLKMTNSGFDFTHLKSEDKAIGYYSLNSGAAFKAKIVDSSVSFAAGAIYSTVGDLYNWDQSLSTQKVLKKASLQNAFTPRLQHYGFGFSIDTLFSKKIISHSGGIDGFLSNNTIFPDDDITIIVLSNSGSSKMSKIIKDIEAIVNNQPYSVPEAANELPVANQKLKHYVGVYELSPAFKITITIADGQLKAQATGQSQFDLFAKKDDLFFLKVVDAEIEFVRDGEGTVEKLILHQGGQHMPGKKVK